MMTKAHSPPGTGGDVAAMASRQSPNHKQQQAEQESINQHPVTIIGLNMIGCELAEQLAKLGVGRFVLIDPGMVRKADLRTQGFQEDEVGVAKVYAAADRLQKISGSIDVQTFAAGWHPSENMAPQGAVIVLAGCGISVRRQTFDQMLLRGKTPCLLDVRASGDTFQCFCVPRDLHDAVHGYGQSLKPMDDPASGFRAGQTTPCCAAMAAGVLCAMSATGSCASTAASGTPGWISACAP